MKKLACFLLTIVIFSKGSYCQSADTSYPSSLSNPRNITVTTSDGETYKGMAIDISIDYIIMDITSNNHLLVNAPYYLRPEGSYYRIDVEYIRSLYTKKPKRVLKSALYGGLAGMVLFGTTAYLSNSDDDSNDLENFFIASGAGLVIGSFVSAITALVVHKKWHIDGSSEKLAEFRDYYF